ncbi:transcriptional regulator [Bosea sp. Root381]|uniref:LysR substrate-binding domain-containing protein n=1 Tax=Bosea sp. Root381 TaxID=1736524 RepID=UPI0007015168|nr:LysR substrate-binding domain-containing protein [Bosea sp. Root381]KRE16852.1 transcriptional regulator [Bosea sp. Root381]
MNLQQFRILQEAVRSGYNFTDAAAALNTSQSGVSKHIKDLELELGVELFERRGKRMLGLTEAGRSVISYVERILADSMSIKRVTDQIRDPASGEFVIATTHTQARYALPGVIKQFRDEFPRVRLSIKQGDPTEITARLRDGSAHIGIATESLSQAPELVAFPYYTWRHIVIAHRDDPLARRTDVGLAEIAKRPIVTYGQGFTGRPLIDAAFRDHDLAPDIVVSAIDSDVIKSYVVLGLGLGIVTEVAFHPDSDPDLVRIAGALFPEATSYIAAPRGRFLPGYAHRFIQLCRPELEPTLVAAAIGAQPK